MNKNIIYINIIIFFINIYKYSLDPYLMQSTKLIPKDKKNNYIRINSKTLQNNKVFDRLSSIRKILTILILIILSISTIKLYLYLKKKKKLELDEKIAKERELEKKNILLTIENDIDIHKQLIIEFHQKNLLIKNQKNIEKLENKSEDINDIKEFKIPKYILNELKNFPSEIETIVHYQKKLINKKFLNKSFLNENIIKEFLSLQLNDKSSTKDILYQIYILKYIKKFFFDSIDNKNFYEYEKNFNELLSYEYYFIIKDHKINAKKKIIITPPIQKKICIIQINDIKNKLNFKN